ncbi:MAG: hypothetical protein KKA19_01760 [Candidatus Margulisbacteria bacterium]|nr:hypothetical protein [Candidatus Margulisiibacteriota bacterium]
MVNVKNRSAHEQEDVEKLTELYMKLEKLQSYIRKIKGRLAKHELDLITLRKVREKRESEMLRGIKAKQTKISDQI